MSKEGTPSSEMKRFLKNEIGHSKRVLDIGCGDGVTALCLISSLNCHVDGIDLDKGSVHRANKKFKKQTTKGLALCRLCDSKNINKKFQENVFDAVLIVHTLHHLTDLSDILLKIRYVLKQGGRLFIGKYARNYGEKIDNCPRFSNGKIKSMLKTAGFGDIRNNNIYKNLVMVTAEKGRFKK